MTDFIDASRQPVVSIRGDEVLANSRDVAAYFGKEHRRVLQTIRELNCSEDFRRHNFVPFKNKDLTGEYTAYVEMTKDGFTFLAMGFTGGKAASFKEAYIKQFNAMETELRKPRSVTVEDLLAHPIQLLTLAQGYALQIEDMKREIAVMQKDVDALDRITKADGLFGIREAAQILQMQERKLTEWLQRNGWCFRHTGNRHLMAYADKRKAGYMTHKMDVYQKPDGTEGTRETLKFTPSGLTRLASFLNVTITDGDLFSRESEAA